MNTDNIPVRPGEECGVIAFSQWLCQASSDPLTTIKLWQRGNETAPLLVGSQWDLIQIDFTLATAAITHLKAQGHHIGPYLMGGMEHAMWWPLPLNTARRLTATPGVIVRPKGSELFVPPPGKYLSDRVWVIPDQSDDRWNTLTSTDNLHGALEAAAHQLARRAATPCP